MEKSNIHLRILTEEGFLFAGGGGVGPAEGIACTTTFKQGVGREARGATLTELEQHRIRKLVVFHLDGTLVGNRVAQRRP